MNAPMRSCERIVSREGELGRDKPKKSWNEVIRHDLRIVRLIENMLMIGGCEGLELMLMTLGSLAKALTLRSRGHVHFLLFFSSLVYASHFPLGCSGYYAFPTLVFH